MNKSTFLNIRISPEEKIIIYEAAKRAKLSVSEYLITSTIPGRLRKIDEPEIIDQELIECLTKREAEVIRLRYGPYENREKQGEIAKLLGISKGRVYQIEHAALSKIRLYSLAQKGFIKE